MPSAPTVKRRPRQNYSPEFKAQLVATCQQPGVSLAAIALANQLNANLLRRWVREHEGRQVMPSLAVSPAPALVPVALQAPKPTEPVVSSELYVEIRHHNTVVQVTWPLAHASACAQWLREILR